MRHHNPTSHSEFSRKHLCTEPYVTYGSTHLAYKDPSMSRRYCKILQWIADHPNRSRKEIIVGVYYGKETYQWYKDRLAAPDEVWSPESKAKFREYLEKWDRGDFSWVTHNPSRYFAEMLWSDLIDYDEKTFRYFIRPKGQKILNQAYINDLAKSKIFKMEQAHD